MHRSFSAVGLFLCLIAAPNPAPAAEPNRGSSDPSTLGPVILLPLIDRAPRRPEAGERPAGEAAREEPCREAALSRIERAFRQHGIEYVRRAELAAALAALKLGLDREGERTPGRLKVLAGALKARYIVTGTIEQAGGDWRRRGLLGEAKAEARVALSVFDAQAGRAREGAELTATAVTRSKTPPSRSDSRLQKLCNQAVREATERALDAFLKPYPRVFAEDPGEAFVVYPTRPGGATPAAPVAGAAPPLPTTPVRFKLVGGQQIEGTIEKFSDGIYTVMTPKGRLYLAQEHVLALSPLP